MELVPRGTLRDRVDEHGGPLDSRALDPQGLRDLADVAELELCMDALSAADPALDPRALEVYVAGRFGHLAAMLSQGRAVTGGMNPPHTEKGAGATRTGPFAQSLLMGPLLDALDKADRDRLIQIVERRGRPSAEAVQEAERELDSGLVARLEETRAKKMARADPDLGAAGVGLAGSLMIWFWCGVLALAGTVFRGGPLMRLFGMAVVTRTGARASRLRLLGRGLLLWLPSGLCFAVAYAWMELATKQTLSAQLRWAELAVLTALPIAGLAWCVLDPTRSPHDRLSGTHLVPR